MSSEISISSFKSSTISGLQLLTGLSEPSPSGCPILDNHQSQVLLCCHKPISEIHHFHASVIFIFFTFFIIFFFFTFLNSSSSSSSVTVSPSNSRNTSRQGLRNILRPHLLLRWSFHLRLLPLQILVLDTIDFDCFGFIMSSSESSSSPSKEKIHLHLRFRGYQLLHLLQVLQLLVNYRKFGWVFFIGLHLV